MYLRYDAIVQKYLTRGCEFEVNLQGSKVDKLCQARDELDSKTFMEVRRVAYIPSKTVPHDVLMILKC